MIYFNINNRMRTSYFFYFIVFTCLLICSCKKEYPDVISNETPVFYFNGNINGSAVNIQAGINDYYMYSSFVQDANKVYNFFGDLKQTNCTSCTNRIQFQINDYKTTVPNGSVVVDSSLMVKYYPIEVPGGTPNGYSVFFSPRIFSADSVQNYLWDFGDGSTSSVSNTLHTYSNSGTYNVGLAMIYSNGCTSSVYNSVKVKNINTQCMVNITGNTMIHAGDSVVLSALFGPACSSISYSWSNGGGANTITVMPTVTTSYSVVACCTSSSCCDTAAVTVTVVPPSQPCLSNFDFYIDTLNGANTFGLSNITIRWTDNTGTTYTSNNAAQPGDSYFQIASVENYSNNEMGQRTKKLHVKFKCKVFSGSNSLQINNGEAVIAVAYK